MRWFYDVKKRKKILGIFILFVITALLCVKIIGRSNSNIGNSADVIITSVPELTMVPKITPTVTATSTATLVPTSRTTPETTPALTPATTLQTILPTALVTSIPTPEIIPTPTITRTPTIIPTPTITLTPTMKKQTPTVTPEKTIVKTSTPKPVSTSPKIESTKVVLKYRNGDASSSTDSIYPVFKVINSGTQSIKLSSIQIRYYYTKEGNKSETFWCDSFSRGATNVYGNFISLSNKKTTADRYLEVGFSESAGEIKAGESVELVVGFAKNDWSEYNQKNDYSYSDSKTYFEWNKVTLYVSGKMVFGKEP